MREIKEILIHCSASSITGQTAAMIQSWHEERGFQSIGYHYFIRNNGLIEQGRLLEQVGAHCYGHNANSIGICLAGKEIRDFTDAQFDSLKLLLRLLKKSWPESALHGHNEFSSKACPVFNVDVWRLFWNSL